MNHAAKKCILHHFADDTNLLYSDKNLKKLTKQMNKELASLFDWLCANRLSLNVGKTEFLIFRPSKKFNETTKLRINQTTIRESGKIKYLGIFLDRHLSFTFQTWYCCCFFSFLYWAKPSCRHSTPRRLLRARASDSAGWVDRAQTGTSTVPKILCLAAIVPGHSKMWLVVSTSTLHLGQSGLTSLSILCMYDRRSQWWPARSLAR